MLAYEEKVKTFIHRHQLIEKGDIIAVGVSGGPDSLSLVAYLADRRQSLAIEVCALHLDHMFRGEESYSELKFVEHFCLERNIPFYSEQIDVAKEMEVSGEGLQEAARRVRYDFFKRGMERMKAGKLALAHHGDDQVETVLMQMTRGGNPQGIPVRRPFGEKEIIRPLLGLDKETIERYCAHYKLNPRRDPSNEKADYTRNRFRHVVLPFLKKENPQVHEHFQRFSEEERADRLLLDELAREEMSKVWRRNKHESVLDIKPFLAMPLPLQRRGIHLILNYLYKDKTPFSFIHIQQILQLLKQEKSSWTLDLPHGLKVCREYQVCVFRFSQAEAQDYAFELNVGEQISWPYGVEFTLSRNDYENRDKESCFVLSSQVKLPLCIRTRRQGDRIHPKGMDGSKKLKDLFIDEKVPLSKRMQWPIVTDHEGKLIWVPGLKRSRYEQTGLTDGQVFLFYTSSNHF